MPQNRHTGKGFRPLKMAKMIVVYEVKANKFSSTGEKPFMSVDYFKKR